MALYHPRPEATGYITKGPNTYNRKMSRMAGDKRLPKHMPKGWKNLLTLEDLKNIGYKRTVEVTPELIKAVSDTVRKGCSIETAFRANRVSPIRFGVFLKKAELGKEPFFSFFEELECISAEVEIELLKKLSDKECSNRMAAQAQWLLERVFTDRYGPSAPKNNKQEITKIEEKKVTVRMELDSNLPLIAKEQAKKKALEAAKNEFEGQVIDIVKESE